MVYHFTPDEIKEIKKSDIYARYKDTKFSSLTVANIVTLRNAIIPQPENLAVLKYLQALIDVLASDSSGRKNVVDQYSSSQYYATRNNSEISRLLENGGSPLTQDIALKLAYLAPTALNNGELGASDFTSGGGATASRKNLVERVEAYLDLTAADLAGSGSAIVKVTEETSGAVLAQLVVSVSTRFAFTQFGGYSTTANKKIQVTVSAGTIALTVSKVAVNCLYRQIATA